MRVIAGKTVGTLRRRYSRINPVDYTLHVIFSQLHRLIELRMEAADKAVSQAIADRQAMVRVALDEISELSSL